MAKSNKPKSKPFDPAEAARQRAAEEEREKRTRRIPEQWGANKPALDLPLNADVKVIAPTRTKVSRVTRYDAFALLESRGSLNADQVSAVRRLMAEIETRFRLGSLAPTERVDCAAPPHQRVMVTDASLDALDALEAVLSRTGALSARLLLALLEPAVREGQPVNNWRAVVEQVTGEVYPHGQVALVRAACENLRAAWADYDNRERRAA